MIRTIVAAVALLVSLAGLALAPAASAQTPSAQDPSAQNQVPAPPPTPFDLAAAIEDGPPMTADRAASLASSTAPTVEQARALSRASEASVARARAAMLPRLELNARYTHIDGFPDGEISLGGDPEALAAARMLAERVEDPAARTLWLGSIDQQATGTATIRIPRDQIAFGARITWPVSDLFFAMLPAIEAAEAGARARALQLEVTDAQVRRSAREAYHQLVRARGSLAVAIEAERQAAAQRAQIEAAVRAGFLTEADRLGAEARVASAARAVTQARVGVEIADAALRSLTGADDGPVYGVTDPRQDAAPEAPGGLDALTDAALARRAELAAIRESLIAQRAAGRASDARGYPHLALYGGADYANPNRYMIPPTQEFQPSWEVGAMLTWSPNDALDAVHAGEERAAQAAATEAQLAQLERAVRLEVRQAHAQLRAARASVEAARAARVAAEAAYESRLAQLRAGEATTAELFATEGQLNAARLAELDAAVQQQLARTHLGYAIGE